MPDGSVVSEAQPLPHSSRHVGVEADATTSGLRIVEQSWAPGLGWFPQRTVAIADDEIDDLIEQLLQARSLRDQAARRTLATAGAAAGTILPFRPRVRVAKSETS
jgi:hypothetical protein